MVMVRKLAGREHGHFVVVEVDDLGGVLDDGAGIGGDDVFVLAHADDQRAALAGNDQGVGLILADDGDAVGAVTSCSAAWTARCNSDTPGRRWFLALISCRDRR